MNDLTVTGKQDFMGIEIPVVAGGFGGDKRCMSDKTIAEIHGMEAKHVRERITQNIVRFKEVVDFIDLKQRVGQAGTLEILLSLGYSKQSITQAEHIYILSERGYAKLIKIMDSDLAWKIHDNLIDEYFELRETKGEYLIDEQSTPQPDTLSTADRIRMMELIATCSPEALEYVAGMAKPYIAASKQPVHPDSVPVRAVEPVKEKMSTSGYMEPFNLSKLKNHLKRTGTTLSELSKKSGVDHSQIGRYLRGVNRPGRDSRDKMCVALGKPRTWLDM